MAKIQGHVGAFFIARKECVYFDGTGGDNITVTDAPTLDFTAGQDLSVTMWLRYPANAAQTPILDKDIAGGTGWQLRMEVAGTLTFRIDSAGGGPWGAGSIGFYDDDVWHFVVAMRDGTTGRIWLYIDTVADPVGGTVGDVGDLSNVVDLTFGNIAAGGANTDEMYIMETHLYDRLLTPAEITAMYNGGDGIWSWVDPNTRAFWQMREGTGVTVHDYSTNNEDGTIGGALWVDAGIAIGPEACGGAHPNYTIINTNVDNLVLLDGGAPISRDNYYYTPAGAITTIIAPLGVVTANYSHYVVSEGGGFHQWSLSGEATEHDITDFQNVLGWADYTVGLKRWNATAQRFWIHQGASYNLADGQRHLVKFYTDDAGNERFEGWGIITGIGPTAVAPDVVIEETMTIRGDDRFSYE